MENKALNQTIKENLQRLRMERGLVQTEIAEKLGITSSSYQKYELRKNPVTPSLPVLIRIADYYGITLDELVGRTVTPSKAVPVKKTLAKHLIEATDSLPKEAKKSLEAALAKAIKEWEDDNQ